MKHCLITMLSVAGMLISSVAQVNHNPDVCKNIVVEVNTNVELLGFVYFLGYQGEELELHDQPFDINGKRTNWKEWYAFGWQLYNQYKSYSGSKNLETAVGIVNKNQLWLDYLIALLIQLDNFPHAKLKDGIPEKYYNKFANNGKEADARANAEMFIDALNHLYTEVHFDQYLYNNRLNYAMVIKQIKSGLPGSNFIPAMESFYRRQLGSYHLVPSLTIPTSMGFGVNYMKDQDEVGNNVFGPLSFQYLTAGDQFDLGFSDKRRIRELSTHEFGHSFVNPVIDSIPESLIEETKALFDTIKNAMSDQAYTDWKTCLYEHFVRAGEIIIARNLGHKTEAADLLKQYTENRKFIYLPVIIRELEVYDKTPNSSYKDHVINALMEMEKTLVH